MEQQRKLTSENLYKEMERLTKEKNDKEITKEKKNIFKKNIKNSISSSSKIILVVIVIISAFFIKHTDNPLKTAFLKYYNQFIYSNVLPSKTYVLGTKTITEKDLNSVLPDIEITGTLEKERNTYMVFKYKNKIYTRKINETFDDGQFKVVNIYGNNMDVEDLNGNVFSFEQKQ